MTGLDLTSTERDAGLAEQARTLPDDLRDHDDGVRTGPHCQGDCGDQSCADVIVWAAVRRARDDQRISEWGQR
jgi:hypothetical protein